MWPDRVSNPGLLTYESGAPTDCATRPVAYFGNITWPVIKICKPGRVAHLVAHRAKESGFDIGSGKYCREY